VGATRRHRLAPRHRHARTPGPPGQLRSGQAGRRRPVSRTRSPVPSTSTLWVQIAVAGHSWSGPRESSPPRLPGLPAGRRARPAPGPACSLRAGGISELIQVARPGTSHTRVGRTLCRQCMRMQPAGDVAGRVAAWVLQVSGSRRSLVGSAAS